MSASQHGDPPFPGAVGTQLDEDEMLIAAFSVISSCVTLCRANRQRVERLPRTVQESRFGAFYSRMRDEEFRAAFRLPRPLFEAILGRLQAEGGMHWR